MAGHGSKAKPLGVDTTYSQVRTKDGPAGGGHDALPGSGHAVLTGRGAVAWTLASCLYRQWLSRLLWSQAPTTVGTVACAELVQLCTHECGSARQARLTSAPGGFGTPHRVCTPQLWGCWAGAGDNPAAVSSPEPQRPPQLQPPDCRRSPSQSMTATSQLLEITGKHEDTVSWLLCPGLGCITDSRALL